MVYGFILVKENRIIKISMRFWFDSEKKKLK